MLQTMYRCLIVAVGCLIGTTASAEQGPYPKDDAALAQAYEALQWQEAVKEYPLPGSHSHIRLPDGFSLVLGADAQRLMYLNNGVEFPKTEAVLYDNQSEAQIDFDYFDEGFVRDDDWSEVDADDFLVQMKEGQSASNEERVANGQEAFEVIGWLEPPTYEAATHVARYVLEMGNAEHHWVNAVAVKLGRRGYHQVTWVGDIDIYQQSGPRVLATALDSHDYDADHRYVDFKAGDNIAAYGIAGLVAAIAGVKLSKGLIAAAIAFLALAGKKLLILIVPLCLALRAWAKRLFGRGTKTGDRTAARD